MRRSSAPGVFLLLLKPVLFIKPKELLNSAERGGRIEHHKDRMLMPNGTSNGRRYDCPLSLSNIGFGFSLRRLKRHERRRSLMTRSATYASSKMHQSGLAGLKRIGAHPSENSHAVSRIGDDGVFFCKTNRERWVCITDVGFQQVPFY